MNTKYKLVLLELITGLLGWLWIIASLAAVYFLVMAVGFDRPWSMFFWALGIGIVAKWLTRGFRDSQIRVAYEADLRARGSTKEEAREAWFAAYSGSSGNESKNDHRLSPERAVEIIQKYGAVMQHDSPAPGCVADVSKLPFPKSQIKEAIIIGLRATSDPKMADALRIGYLQLADWQEGVGDSNVGLDLTHVDPTADITELAESIVAYGDGYERWSPNVTAEQDALKRELIELGLWE